MSFAERVYGTNEKRVQAFMETAKFNMGKENYDLVIFNVEQAIQLY